MDHSSILSHLSCHRRFKHWPISQYSNCQWACPPHFWKDFQQTTASLITGGIASRSIHLWSALGILRSRGFWVGPALQRREVPHLCAFCVFSLCVITFFSTLPFRVFFTSNLKNHVIWQIFCLFFYCVTNIVLFSVRYYGCGIVVPECLENCRILDLGSGSGRDCYMLSKLVGQKGYVTGVDMTDEQVIVATPKHYRLISMSLLNSTCAYKMHDFSKRKQFPFKFHWFMATLFGL